MIWKIASIPRNTGALFCENNLSTLILQLATLNTDTGLEIIFASAPTHTVSVFLNIISNDCSVKQDMIAAIESVLTSLNYGFHRATPVEISELNTARIRQAEANIQVLVKTERATTSSLSYLGYYYYADIIKSRTSYFPELFHILSESHDSMVWLQLIPTQFMPIETVAINDLVSTLPAAIRGISNYGQIFAEPYAQAPLDYYSYYAQQQGRPVFLYNIAAVSSEGNAGLLLSTIQSALFVMDAGAPAMSIVDIPRHIAVQLTSEIDSLPWALNAYLQKNCRNYSIWSLHAQPVNLARMPYLLSAEEACAFWRLPVDDGKTPGIISNPVTNSKEAISSNAMQSDGIKIGHIKDNPSIQISPKCQIFTRHALVVGMPGMGKTTFAINLLMQFHQKGIPFLAIEPTKTEYRAMIAQIPDLQVFTPGRSDIVPFVLNPFVPPKGIRLEQYIPSLVSAFKVAFSMPSPLDTIFLSTIRKCYTKYGWKNSSKSSDPDVEIFGLFEFIREFRAIVSSASYSKDVRSNIETGGTFRLMNLLEQNSNIYDTQFTMPVEELLSHPTIIELNAIADEEQRSLVMALLLVSLCLYIKNSDSSNGELKNIILIDEAHVLLDAHSESTSEKYTQESAVKVIQNMIAEVRSYGTGIIIADQTPSRVGRNIVANTDIKVAFRLVESEERNIIADSTNMQQDHKEYLSRLQPGEAFVYFTGLEPPRLVVTPDFRTEAGIALDLCDDVVASSNSFWALHSGNLKPFYECSVCPQCVCGCNSELRILAEYYADKFCDAFSQKIKTATDLFKFTLKLHELVLKYESNCVSGIEKKRLCNCTKVQFIRKVLLTGAFDLRRGQLISILEQSVIKEATDVRR